MERSAQAGTALVFLKQEAWAGLTHALIEMTIEKPPIDGLQASGWFWSETLTMLANPATVKRRKISTR